MAGAFLGAQASAVPAGFQLAWAHAGARKDALALHPQRLDETVYLGLAEDVSVALAAGRLDVPAKCLGVDRDFRLAADLDCRLAEGALPVERAPLDEQAQYQVQRLQAALLRVAFPQEPLLLAELAQLQLAQGQLSDEWVPEDRLLAVLRASRLQELQAYLLAQGPVPMPAPWAQLSEPRAQ